MTCASTGAPRSWPVPPTAEALVGDIDYCRAAFVARGVLSDEHLLPMPRKSTYWGEAVLAVKLDVSCTAGRAGEGVALIGYDDEYAVEYFSEPLRAWWRRHPEASPQRMLNEAFADAAAVRERCAAFDAQLLSRPSASAATNTPASSPSPTGRRSAPASWSPRPTAGRFSFRKRTSATPAWGRWTSITNRRRCSCTRTRN